MALSPRQFVLRRLLQDLGALADYGWFLQRRLAVISSGAKNLVQAFQDLRQLLRRCSTEAIPDPLGRERSDLIFTQERFGKRGVVSSSVSGKPARGGWLVSATAITVPDRSLKTSWLKISTGRWPD
jgi:hypothetical protein